MTVYKQATLFQFQGFEQGNNSNLPPPKVKKTRYTNMSTFLASSRLFIQRRVGVTSNFLNWTSQRAEFGCRCQRKASIVFNSEIGTSNTFPKVQVTSISN